MKIDLFGSMLEVHPGMPGFELRFDEPLPTVVIHRRSGIIVLKHVEEIHVNYEPGRVAVESPRTGQGYAWSYDDIVQLIVV